MTLISILLAVWLEKIVNDNEKFQFKHYFDSYWHKYVSDQQSFSSQALILGLPLLVFLIIDGILPELLNLPVQVLVLVVCMGCPHYRHIYKTFLQASERGDQQACFHYSQQLGVNVEEQGRSTVGQTLVWHNYQYYLAVMFWFVLAGTFGALVYCMLRETVKQQCHPSWDKAMTIADWVPARLTALGYLLVGHYNKAASIWINVVSKIEYKAQAILAEVAIAADENTLDSCSSDEAISLVKLAKRTTLLAMAGIALATLAGWVR